MKTKKTIIIIITVIVISLLVFLSSVIFSVLNMNNSAIFSGITINNIDVSGMTKDEASSMLTKLINKKLKHDVILTYIDTTEDDKKNNFETTLDLSVINTTYDIKSSIDKAYNIGRSGNIFQNNFAIAKSLFKKNNINIDISVDEKILKDIILDISSSLPEKVLENSYYIEDDKLIITRGTAGNTVDSDKFINTLDEILNNISISENNMEIPVKYTNPPEIDVDSIHSKVYKEPKDAYYDESPFKVYAEVKGIDFDVQKVKSIISENPNDTEYTIDLTYTNPEVKLTDLDIDMFPDLLSTFSTRYDAKNKDRTTNLNLSASKINGTILSPGEEFSYNTIVGERTISAGYKEAKVYENGQIVDGLGGGICQISSTLYNAVVFANLKVTKRYNHQFVTSYVPEGRDATVVYGLKDFKFVNNRTYPIKIEMTVNSGIAKVNIYGIKEEVEYDVSFDVETVSNILYDTKYEDDFSLPEGTEKVKKTGVNGIKVNTYKVIKQNGITISRELISKDTYNAMDEIILRGNG